jgi:hypothetical protein
MDNGSTVAALQSPASARTCHECGVRDVTWAMHQVSVTVAAYTGITPKRTIRRVWLCDVCYSEPGQP